MSFGRYPEGLCEPESVPEFPPQGLGRFRRFLHRGSFGRFARLFFALHVLRRFRGLDSASTQCSCTLCATSANGRRRMSLVISWCGGGCKKSKPWLQGPPTDGQGQHPEEGERPTAGLKTCLQSKPTSSGTSQAEPSDSTSTSASSFGESALATIAFEDVESVACINGFGSFWAPSWLSGHFRAGGAVISS